MMPLLDTLLARLSNRLQPATPTSSAGPPFDDVLRDASDLASSQDPSASANPEGESEASLPESDAPLEATELATPDTQASAPKTEATPVVSVPLPIDSQARPEPQSAEATQPPSAAAPTSQPPPSSPRAPERGAQALSTAGLPDAASLEPQVGTHQLASSPSVPISGDGAPVSTPFLSTRPDVQGPTQQLASPAQAPRLEEPSPIHDSSPRLAPSAPGTAQESAPAPASEPPAIAPQSPPPSQVKLATNLSGDERAVSVDLAPEAQQREEPLQHAASPSSANVSLTADPTPSLQLDVEGLPQSVTEVPPENRPAPSQTTVPPRPTSRPIAHPETPGTVKPTGPDLELATETSGLLQPAPSPQNSVDGPRADPSSPAPPDAPARQATAPEARPLSPAPSAQVAGQRTPPPEDLPRMEIESISPPPAQSSERPRVAPPQPSSLQSATPAPGIPVSTLVARATPAAVPDLAAQPSLAAQPIVEPEGGIPQRALSADATTPVPPADVASTSIASSVSEGGEQVEGGQANRTPSSHAWGTQTASQASSEALQTLRPLAPEAATPNRLKPLLRPASVAARAVSIEAPHSPAERPVPTPGVVRTEPTLPTERIAPTERAVSGLEVETLATSDVVRKVAQAEAKRPNTSPEPSFSEPLMGRAGEDFDAEAPQAPMRSRTEASAPRTSEPARPSAEAPKAPLPTASGPLLGTTPPLPHAVTPPDEPVGAVDSTMPILEPTTPHQIDARTATPDDGVRPAAPPVPARLAMPVWLERLTPSSERHVQVGLGDDGSVRLQTVRQPDGITVQIQFTDPELQALASVHADRLRAALETHFSEPVRLSLPDGLATDSGTTDSGASDPGFTNSRQSDDGPTSDSRHTRTSGSDSSSQTPTRAPLNGRREWVG